MAKRHRVSTLVKDAQSAGLPDDIDVTIKKSFYAIRSSADYKQEAAEDADDAVPCWVLILQPDDGDEFELVESCGNIKRVVPSEDGTYLESELASVVGTSNSCKQFLLLESMIDCEESVDVKANTDISSLEGMKWHLLRKPAPKSWSTMADPEPGPDGKKKRPPTIETCTEIYSLPWKGKGKGSAGASAPAKGKKAAAAEPEPEDDGSSEAEEIVDAIVKEKSPVKAASLYKLAQGAAKKSGNKDKIIELLQDDEWLGHADRPWLFEDGVLSTP